MNGTEVTCRRFVAAPSSRRRLFGDDGCIVRLYYIVPLYRPRAEIPGGTADAVTRLIGCGKMDNRIAVGSCQLIDVFARQPLSSTINC